MRKPGELHSALKIISCGKIYEHGPRAATLIRARCIGGLLWDDSAYVAAYRAGCVASFRSAERWRFTLLPHLPLAAIPPDSHEARAFALWLGSLPRFLPVWPNEELRTAWLGWTETGFSSTSVRPSLRHVPDMYVGQQSALGSRVHWQQSNPYLDNLSPCLIVSTA